MLESNIGRVITSNIGDVPNSTGAVIHSVITGIHRAGVGPKSIIFVKVDNLLISAVIEKETIRVDVAIMHAFTVGTAVVKIVVVVVCFLVDRTRTQI